MSITHKSIKSEYRNIELATILEKFYEPKGVMK